MYSNYKMIRLYEGEKVKYKPSEVLEDWYCIFIDNQYIGTINKDQIKSDYAKI